jgi:hypothetical protein
MKESVYNEKMASHGYQWETKNVKPIALGFILGKVSGAQIRQDGTDPHHTEEVLNSIVTFGQKVPVTVEQVGHDAQNNPTYRIVDGNHRYDAISKLQEKNPSDARYAVIKVFVENFKNDWERTKYQSDMNAHETPSKLSSENDAVVSLKHVINNGLSGAPPAVAKLHNSHDDNFNNTTQYTKDLKKAVRLMFPGFSENQCKNVVRTLQSKELPGKFQRWTAGAVKEAFMNWALCSGIDYDEDMLHTIKNENYIDWQLIGRCIATKSDYSKPPPRSRNDENIVIMYWSNITGKDNKALNNHRVKMIEKINKRNSSWMFRTFKGFGKVKAVDRIFLAPQKRDVAEEEVGFFEVKKNAKGQFSTTLIARDGWNTKTSEVPPIGGDVKDTCEAWL